MIKNDINISDIFKSINKSKNLLKISKCLDTVHQNLLEK